MRTAISLAAAFSLLHFDTAPGATNASHFAFSDDTSLLATSYRFAMTLGVRPVPSPVEPQTIRFTNIDAKHVRLTLLDDRKNATSEDVVTDRTQDGQLHAKLKRHSHWALPIATYDRVVAFAEAGDTIALGSSTKIKVRPLASGDSIDGVAISRAGAQAQLAFDGTGSVSPSFDVFGSPGGGGRSRKADATVHLEASFDNAGLTRADASESLDFGNSRVAKATWSIERVE